MTTIYDATTLRKVSSDARLAEYTRVKEEYVPSAINKINEANFAAANTGRQSSVEDLTFCAWGSQQMKRKLF